MYFHIYSCVFIFTHVFLYLFMYFHIYSCIFIYSCSFIFIHVFLYYSCIFMFIHVFFIFIHVYLYLFMYFYIYIYIHIKTTEKLSRQHFLNTFDVSKVLGWTIHIYVFHFIHELQFIQIDEMHLYLLQYYNIMVGLQVFIEMFLCLAKK